MPHSSKLIGLVGGVSWTSTLEYYRRLNERVYLSKGGYESARILLTSINFSEILTFQQKNQSDLEVKFLLHELRRLEKGGADCALICSNTTNKTINILSRTISMPLISLPESVAIEANRLQLHTVGLLGTTYTMYGDFYRDCLQNHGLQVLIPEKHTGLMVHNLIYEELVKGAVLSRSAAVVDNACEELISAGAEAVILGCTELPLLCEKMQTQCMLLDTVNIHINCALQFAFA